MHINRKPGEQVEVDWAGDLATIIDPDTGEIIKAYIFVVVMTYSQYAYEEWCEQLGSNASSLADQSLTALPMTVLSHQHHKY